MRIQRILTVIFVSCFAIFSITACSSKKIEQNEPEIYADWPVYSIEQMVQGKSDLVVLANVASIKNVEDKDELKVQISTLEILDVFYGEPVKHPILLYQSIDKVKLNQTYLLFLKYKPEDGFYVLSDGNSLTKVTEDKNSQSMDLNELEIDVKVKGIKGNYSIDELHEIFAQYK